MRRPLHPIVATLLCLGIASSAGAVTRDWITTAGGNFGVSTNWSPNGIPTSGDIANFNLNSTYTVTLSNNATVNTLTQSQGDVTLLLNGQTLLATSNSASGMGAAGLTSTLRVGNGIIGGNFNPNSFTIGTVATSTANLYLNTLTVSNVNTGPFYVGSSGTGNLYIQNGATLATPIAAVLGLNSTGVGTATVVGTGSLWNVTNNPLRVGSAGIGTLNILGGGAVTAPALEVGELLNSVGTISMSGNLATFTTPGTANIGGTLTTAPALSATLNISTGATMNLNGTTNLRTNAKVNVTGGTLNLATVNVTPGAVVNWSAGTINFANASAITPTMLDLLLTSTSTLGNNRALSAGLGTFNLTTPLVLNGGRVSVPTLTINANTELNAFSTITATNTVTLNAGTTMQLGNFATLNATTSIINNGGTLELHGPLANVTGLFANNAGYVHGTGRFTAGLNNNAGGTIRLETDDHIIIDTAGRTNLGTIDLAGGTVEYSQSLTNQVGGTISGRGTFRGSSAAPGGTGISNLGVMSYSAGISDIYGDVNNGATGKIVAAGASTVTFFDDVVNNGDIKTVLGSRTVFFGAVSGAGTFTGGGTTEFEGDLKPGNSPANVTFGGNVQIDSGAGLSIELGGAAKGAQYDSLTIAGIATLSGGLDAALINNFTPTAGQSFEILTAAGGIDGTFDTISLPDLAGGLYFNLAYGAHNITLSVAGILGDYNHSGSIDASDYVLWRKSLSLTGNALAADGNNNGVIDSADFTVWRSSYGTQASGSGLAAAIPEPTALLLISIAATMFTLHRRAAKRS